MTKKKITFKPASEIRMAVEQEIDQWVKGPQLDSVVSGENNVDNSVVEQKEVLYRLSIDIPKYLHKRIKKTCAVEDISMRDRLTEILLNAFPEK
jgi:hypothetical protein